MLSGKLYMSEDNRSLQARCLIGTMSYTRFDNSSGLLKKLRNLLNSVSGKPE